MTAAVPTKASSSAGAPPAAIAKVVPVLEEQPKWVLLRQVAEEVQQQRALMDSLATSAMDAYPQRAQQDVHQEPRVQGEGSRGSRKRPRAESPADNSEQQPPTHGRQACNHVEDLTSQRPLNSGTAAGTSAGASRRVGGNVGEVVDLCDDSSPAKGPQHTLPPDSHASGVENCQTCTSCLHDFAHALILEWYMHTLQRKERPTSSSGATWACRQATIIAFNICILWVGHCGMQGSAEALSMEVSS